MTATDTLPTTSATETYTPTTLDLLTDAVRREPADAAARGALYDLLIEQGTRPLTARRRVNQIVREATAAQTLAAARVLIDGTGAKSARTRTAVRAAVGRGTNSSIPVTVVAGDAAPVLSGEEAYTTFRKGGVCHYPGAARRAGYKLDYHPSTLAITVGAGWVLTHAR